MDNRPYSFSQAQGYEELPGPLKLDDLPKDARTRIWNLFFVHLQKSQRTDNVFGESWIAGDWADIFLAEHATFEAIGALDDWRTDFEPFCKDLRKRIKSLPFNKVFDLIQFVLRHPRCPRGFVTGMRSTFMDSHLSYTIDVGPPPTIVPATTPEEGVAIVESLQSLRQAGLDGSAAHLRKASECITEGDWAGSVRESIHGVESAARQLDPEAAQTLRPALKSIERRGALHPALTKAFDMLYGYTSNEQGIRHALLDQMDTKVGLDEAVFMLGACASFASYLWRKHVA